MSIGDGLFYYPTRSVYGRPETYGLTHSSEWFTSLDGTRLHGWFFPAEPHTDREPLGTIVHFHGNSGNISGHFEFVRWLPALGWNVFCFDFRGYGRSEGKPSRPGTIEDGQAALTHVKKLDGVDPGRIVVFGQSLGGAVGIVVTAMSSDIRGLAVEGAFSDYQREADFVSRQNVIVRPVSAWLSRAVVSRGYDPIDWVSRIAPRPTMFICGTRDTIVDYRQTVDLHAAAGDPKELHIIEDGGHTDTLQTDEGKARLTDFFQRCLDGSLSSGRTT
jgi:hypothetical protein